MTSPNQPDSALNDRVGRLETGQQNLSDKIDQILGIVGKSEHSAQRTAQSAREAELNAPTSIADEIRAQLDKRDKERAAEAKSKTLEDRLAALESGAGRPREQAPEPPARGIEKAMGWR